MRSSAFILALVVSTATAALTKGEIKEKLSARLKKYSKKGGLLAKLEADRRLDLDWKELGGTDDPDDLIKMGLAYGFCVAIITPGGGTEAQYDKVAEDAGSDWAVKNAADCRKHFTDYVEKVADGDCDEPADDDGDVPDDDGDDDTPTSVAAYCKALEKDCNGGKNSAKKDSCEYLYNEWYICQAECLGDAADCKGDVCGGGGDSAYTASPKMAAVVLATAAAMLF